MNASWRLVLANYFERIQQSVRNSDELKVAVTGHRMNRLTPESYQQVSNSVATVLQELQTLLSTKASSYVTPIIVSALAEG